MESPTLTEGCGGGRPEKVGEAESCPGQKGQKGDLGRRGRGEQLFSFLHAERNLTYYYVNSDHAVIIISNSEFYQVP